MARNGTGRSFAKPTARRTTRRKSYARSGGGDQIGAIMLSFIANVLMIVITVAIPAGYRAIKRWVQSRKNA